MIIVTLFEQELRLRFESDATLRHRIVVDDALLLEECMHAHYGICIALEMTAAGRRREIVGRVCAVKLDYKVTVLYVYTRRFAGVLAAEKFWQCLLLIIGHGTFIVVRIKPGIERRAWDVQRLEVSVHIVGKTRYCVCLLDLLFFLRVGILEQ